MKEVKGHIFHGKRKWRCPQCQKIKMQKPKSKNEAQRPMSRPGQRCLRSRLINARGAKTPSDNAEYQGCHDAQFPGTGCLLSYH